MQPGYNRAGALESVDLVGPLADDNTGPHKTYVQRLAYSAKGQRTLIAYGNGKITRYAYDTNTFRLVRMRTEDYSQPLGAHSYQLAGGLLQDLAYQYDLGGNILRITDRTQGSGVRNNSQALVYPELQTLLAAGDSLVREFAYDPLYRLISATGRECSDIADPRPGTDDARCGYSSGNHGTANQENAPDMTSLYEEQYEYDPAGNMLRLKHSRDGTGGWSRYFGMAGFKPKEWKEKVASFLAGNSPDLGGGGNRLTNFGNDEEQSTSHAYDANGNMVRENTERHFEWDYSNRMKTFRNQTDTSKPTTYALYLYDAGGQRVKKLVVEGNGYRTTTYLGAVFEHHAEYTQLDGGEKTENCSLHVMDDKSRIAIVRVGDAFDDDGAKVRVQYHLGDHLGSSGLVIGGETVADSVFINREEFFPYGETSFGSFGRKQYRFTGKERDEESGFSYHGARYLNLTTHRWLSTDPLGIPDGLNLFAYSANSPITYADSTGLAKDPPIDLKHTWWADSEWANNVRRGYEGTAQYPGPYDPRIASDSAVSRVLSDAAGKDTQLSILKGREVAPLTKGSNTLDQLGLVGTNEDKARHFANKTNAAEDVTRIVNQAEKRVLNTGCLDTIAITSFSKGGAVSPQAFTEMVEVGLKNRGLEELVTVELRSKEQVWSIVDVVRAKSLSARNAIKSIGESKVVVKAIDTASELTTKAKNLASGGSKAFSFFGDLLGPLVDFHIGGVEVGLSSGVYIPLPWRTTDLNLPDGTAVVNPNPETWGTANGLGKVQDGRATYSQSI